MDGDAFRVGPAAHGGHGVFAARDLAAGERIGRFEGTPVAAPTRFSLQFGPGLHLDPGDHPLRNLNHACAPTAAFRGRDLHALQAIPAGGEVTIDYNCHEAGMSAPFACACGAPDCVGRVAGWSRLGAMQREARRDRVAAWLTGSTTSGSGP